MNSQLPLLNSPSLRWGAAGFLILLLAIGIATPNLLRSKLTAYEANSYAAASRAADAAGSDRKIVQTGSMSLIVAKPAETSDKIRLLTEQLGGFIVNSETREEDRESIAYVSIRVPADKFEEARSRIRKLGLRIENEKLEARDVTGQYIDQSARIRNLHAQEIQYLGILKQAKTIKETLEVSDKLNAVRGEIEQQQSEFDGLSKQVETVALTVSLHPEVDARVFGLNWRPLYQLKLAARDGVEAIGLYASVMATVLFYIPAALLWLGTVGVGLTVGWSALRWARKRFFAERTGITSA